MDGVAGTAGYAGEADALVQRYESISFAEVHGAVLHLLPSAPCEVLEIGAGTGRDAAALAALGHRVVAVEPTGELRRRAAALHPSPNIEWLDDALPDLARLAEDGEQFDLAMLTAMWMHLDENERPRAMARLGELVRPGGRMIMSLRHGPIPAGRRMFAVSGDETIRLGKAAGFRLLLECPAASALRTPDVNWTRLAFEKTPPMDAGTGAPI
jgi:protein-L-isoaspartate O-methyltransferase